MKRHFLFLILFLSLSVIAFGQETEHNFEMGPQVTDCDSLDLSGLDIDQQIASIESTKFRFHQKLRLNRPEGFQAAWFYSCDNMSGYFIAKIDGVKHLYMDVSKEQWKSFMSSGDFFNYIKENFE